MYYNSSHVVKLTKEKKMKLRCEYTNADGIRTQYKLKYDDVIQVARCAKSFAYSSKPEYIEMTVREAIKGEQFDTCRGTMLVNARINLDNDKIGSIWKIG